MNSLLAQEIKGLVIDLRDNPGGDYREVVKICDMLLPNGLIVYVEDRYGNRREEFSDSNHIDIPMSVLINGYSASASEIMSAALKDYGKESLWEQKPLERDWSANRSALYKWRRVEIYHCQILYSLRQHIHDVGVEPDIEVVLDEEFKSTSIDDIPTIRTTSSR